MLAAQHRASAPGVRMLDDCRERGLVVERLPSPGHAAVALWLIDIAASDIAAAFLAQTLSAAELSRMARFIHDADQRRFCITRLAVRHLLGALADRSPSDVAFGEGPSGKPYLASGGDLQFNVSHSGDLAIIGVAQGLSIGVDIEFRRHGIDATALARRFFAAAESDLLLSLPPDRRVGAFYDIWTAKEAVLKARGLGIADHLKSFSVARRGGDILIDPAPVPGGRLFSGLAAHILPLSPSHARTYAGAYAIEIPDGEQSRQ
jgi:4'-phosphopantetheinyl transferase